MLSRGSTVRVLVLTCVAGVAWRQPDKGTVIQHVPSKPDPATRYVFYLHGRIVEEQGARAVSPDFGAYDYTGITRALAAPGFVVVSEIRAKDTDPERYADSVVAEIGRLRNRGVPEEHITVVGASKGAGITLRVSERLAAPQVGFVALAGCNDDGHARSGLHGRVLSVYEESDELGRSCAKRFAASRDLTAHDEVHLNTGLQHGFLYRPLREWVEPVVAWIRRAPKPR
jgi:hypothetical protein